MGNMISSFAAEAKEWLPPNGRRADKPKCTHDCDATCLDERTSSSRTVPVASKHSASEHDWHTEILCGLFLRSNEHELMWLEREIGASDNSSCISSQSPPHSYSFGEKGGDNLDRKEEKEQGTEVEGHTDYASSIGGENVAKHLQTDQTKPPNDEYLYDILHLGQTIDSTVLSLIPEALRGLPIMPAMQPTTRISMGNSFEDDEYNGIHYEGISNISAVIASTNLSVEGGGNKSRGDFHNPLLIPPSWRRWDYASRTLPELDRHLIDPATYAVRGNTMRVNSDVKDGKVGSLHLPPKRGLKTFELFTMLYNECSLTAIANWAIFDNPIESYDSMCSDKTKERWKNCKEDQEKERVTNKTQYKIIIPLPKFHRCGVCGRLGHYEVECKILFDDGKKRGRENAGQEEWNDFGRKKMKTQDDVARGVVFDEKEKISDISGLSREIHIQKRQSQLFDKYCFGEKKEKRRDNKGYIVLVPPSLDTARVPRVVENGDEGHYSGKSYCCRVCLSGLDDGEMLVCDGCDGLFHCKCIDPPLSSIPEGDWFCGSCLCHDSDVSSIVDIEACEDFVLEQRNRLLAEKNKLYSGVNTGETKCSWTTALSLLAEQDPFVDDELYIRKHLGREYSHLSDDFFPSEICWAKRFDDRLGRVEWWPAIVSESKSRSLKFSRKTTYTVIFFALNEDADIHETDVLPFLPYYEDIGHKRLMRCDNSGHETFQHALILGVSRLGLKSLGQALKLARNGIQMAAMMNIEHGKLLPADWKIPVGWELAEIEKVDGMVILAQKKTDLDYSAKRYSTFIPSWGSVNEGENSVQESFANHKMVAQFCEVEILGSIVSWQSEFGISYGSERPEIQYGLVISIDVPTEVALVRIVPMLSGVHLDAKFHDDSIELHINATNIGATTWIPLRQVRFISGKSAHHDLSKFRRKLLACIGHEVKSYSKQCKKDAQFREEFTLELEDNSSQFFTF